MSLYAPHSVGRLIASGIGVVVVVVVCVILEVVDRATASPGMRKRFNEGSDKFFRERGSILHAAIGAAAEFFGDVGSHWL